MQSKLLILLTTLALTATGRAQTSDPFIWLEEVSSPQSMAWVDRQNGTTTNRLEADPHYARNYAEALEIAGAQDRIPDPEFVHGEIYNFWQDPDHLHAGSGARPRWTITPLRSRTGRRFLDIDALNKAEGKSFGLFKGAELLKPEETRCMIELSDGGEDAVVAREFDLDASKFVDGGFTLPRGKHRIAWEDKDTLLIATDWTPGDLTTSGYPYIVKRLKRGQPLSAAFELFRGTKDDGGYGVDPFVLHDGQGHSLAFVKRPLDTFHSEHYVLTERGAERMSIPAKADLVDLVQGRVILKLDEAWAIAGKTFEPGSVVQTELAATKASPGALRPALVWAPGSREALNGISSTREKLLLGVLDNVQGKAFVYTPSSNGWTRKPLPVAHRMSPGEFLAAADDKSNRAFINVSGFLSPTALWLADVDTSALRTVKTLPPKFDASHEVVEQFAAASSDGTKIPYFVVHREGTVLNGSTPTLLTAYGGFQIRHDTATGSGSMEGKLQLAGARRRLCAGEYPGWR